MFHSPKALGGPRLSPDDRFVAYTSEETGKNELYVRPFNPNAGPSSNAWKISEQGAQGMAFWRRDGRELSFLATDQSIMSVSLTTAPDFEFGKPKLLFRVPESTRIGPGFASVNRDGDRFVIAVPPPQLRQLTIVDRQGKTLSTVGQPALYGRVLFSPDGKRILAAKIDPQTGVNNMWVFDIASGKATAITNDSQSDINNFNPIWSPDGKYVAYVVFKDKYSHIYRKAADGTGEAELLFRYTPGAGMGLSDWSPDGKFLTFSTGVMLVLPLRAGEKALDRKALEWLREDYDAFDGHFSPDGRSLAYFSNEADVLKTQVYVRPFDPNKPDAPAGPAVQVSNVKGGAGGSILWRKDGKEMYFLNLDREVLAVNVTTAPNIQAGTPHALFKLDPLVGSGAVSPDGERFVLAMPVK
jgi:Tol biopolymer transport system component